MNRFANKRRIVLMIAVLALAVVLVACKQETPATEPAAATEPVVTTAPEVTEATEAFDVEIETFPEVDAPEAGSITYAEYLKLSVEVQQAYYDQFESAEAFHEWLDAAKAEYNAATEPVKILGSETTPEETQGKEPQTGETKPSDPQPTESQVHETWSGGFLEESVEDWD